MKMVFMPWVNELHFCTQHIEQGKKQKQKPAFQESDTHGCVMRLKLLKGPWMRCFSSCAHRRPPATAGMFLCTVENPGDTDSQTEARTQPPAPSDQ
jgi:hypothetical protein